MFLEDRTFWVNVQAKFILCTISKYLQIVVFKLVGRTVLHSKMKEISNDHDNVTGISSQNQGLHTESLIEVNKMFEEFASTFMSNSGHFSWADCAQVWSSMHLRYIISATIERFLWWNLTVFITIFSQSRWHRCTVFPNGFYCDIDKINILIQPHKKCHVHSNLVC